MQLVNVFENEIFKIDMIGRRCCGNTIHVFLFKWSYQWLESEISKKNPADLEWVKLTHSFCVRCACCKFTSCMNSSRRGAGGSWPLIPSKERIKKVDPPSAAQSLRFLRRYLHVFFCVTARHLSFYAYIHYVWLNLMWQPLGHWKLFHVWLNQSAASTGVITAAGNQSLKTVAYCVIP